MGNRNPFIREIRQLFGKSAPLRTRRLSGYHFGDVTLDDAIVYRIK
jgi:hypothetical protein